MHLCGTRGGGGRGGAGHGGRVGRQSLFTCSVLFAVQQNKEVCVGHADSWSWDMQARGFSAPCLLSHPALASFTCCRQFVGSEHTEVARGCRLQCVCTS